MQPILLNGTWTESRNPSGSFHAYNPANAQAIEGREFPISSWDELEEMVEAGASAAAELCERPPEQIAAFLEGYAAALEARREELAATAHHETGLPIKPRLAEIELPRATGQLRQAALAVRSGDWSRPTIDTAANIRSIHGPLGGPVLVFGPNNFPFAFHGVSGGDFAAAIAAGNPVIAKAHPGHPYTTQLLAESALEALSEAGLPPATVQLFYHTSNDLGLRLVSHPKVAAIAFTGSRAAGLALKKAADETGKPAYLEMSSVNPVFFLPGVLRERGSQLAEELLGSCAMGAGQFCTKPGIAVAIESEDATRFQEALLERFQQAAPGLLLTRSGVDAVEKAVRRLQSAGAEALCGAKRVDEGRFAYQPTLLRVSGDRFLEAPEALQSEAFGTVCLLVVARNLERAEAIARSFEGNLTGCLYSAADGSDDQTYRRLAAALRPKVGRLLNDKMPTGVAVSPAMNHGGPFPATGHPVFTAVGFPASILRFSALHCYDNVRHDRLPAALQDKNPTGKLRRLVDGEWTTDDIA